MLVQCQSRYLWAVYIPSPLAAPPAANQSGRDSGLPPSVMSPCAGIRGMEATDWDETTDGAGGTIMPTVQPDFSPLACHFRLWACWHRRLRSALPRGPI